MGNNSIEHMNSHKTCNLAVYNTLSRKIEKFIPSNNNFIGIYNCGPTLHEFHTHIGNLRSYVFADFVKRYLKYLGFEVKHVIKITDVDDHILKECLESGGVLDSYTGKRLDDFSWQLKEINILNPVILPRVTNYIKEINEANEILAGKNLTYLSNGSLYFKVSQLEDYGVLVNRDKKESLKKNAQKRLKDFVLDDKDSEYDFCLWKAYRPDLDGNVFWESKYGKGRPGWHLECAVISQKNLGENFDIHVGGISHIFPHHTNEIAIAEAISGKKFVNYWLHHDYLVVNGEKMSKEGGTFYMLPDIVSRGYHPLILRYVLLKTHYRQKLNFTWSSMDEAKLLLVKIVTFLNSLDFVADIKNNNFDADAAINEAEIDFLAALDNDFNFSDAMKALIGFEKKINRDIDQLNLWQAKKIKDFILKIDEILGCVKPLYEKYRIELIAICEQKDIKSLYNERIAARREKDFTLADSTRKKIESVGLIVKDCQHSSLFILELKKFL
jgi:cysteinyl-tRNA synthetase